MISPEELAAFADGELDPDRAAEVAAATAADRALAEQVRVHRALRAQLSQHYAPIIEAPAPEKLSRLLQPSADVIDIIEERVRRTKRVVRWGWVAGPALAASLAFAVFVPRGGEPYVRRDLAHALDTQLVAEQSGPKPTRILLSFRNDKGAYCRAFTGAEQSGIACREDKGWRLKGMAAGTVPESGDYRMAGSPAAEILERAQEIAAGPALTAEEERAAMARGWR